MNKHIYETGFVSSKWTIEAPSADTAAFYTMFNLANGFGTLMTVVYTEDGHPYMGKCWWLGLAMKSDKDITPEDEAFLETNMQRIKAELPFCKVIEVNS